MTLGMLINTNCENKTNWAALYRVEKSRFFFPHDTAQWNLKRAFGDNIYPYISSSERSPELEWTPCSTAVSTDKVVDTVNPRSFS